MSLKETGSIKEIRSGLSKVLRESIPPYILMLPALVIFCLFTLYPIFWSLKYCLYDYNGSSVPLFIGLDNFKKLFSFKEIMVNPNNYYRLYWASWVKTLTYAGLKTALETPLAFACAYLIHKKVKGAKFFRTLFYMPQILPNMVIFMVISIMLNPYNGVIIQLLSSLGIISKNYSFFMDAKSAFLVGVIADAWYYFGINMLFFIAGLSSVSKEVSESATVDGANELQELFFITIPMMIRIARIIIMLSLVGCLKAIGSYFILTRGGPNHGTELTFLYIYNIFFPDRGAGESVARYGFGAAVAIVSAAIIGVITFFYLKLSEKFQYD